MFIPDPDFCPSRIPDPKTATKETVKIWPQISQNLKLFYFLSRWRKKNSGQFTKKFRTFYPKKALKNWVWDPGSRSGKNLFRIPDSGVKKAPDPGSATLEEGVMPRVVSSLPRRGQSWSSQHSPRLAGAARSPLAPDQPSRHTPAQKTRSQCCGSMTFWWGPKTWIRIRMRIRNRNTVRSNYINW